MFGDKRGKLVSLESNKNIPFSIKRVYYIFDTPSDEIRGFHAHKELQQLVIALNGSVKFILDDGKSREEILLNNPSVGLFIGKNMWREMLEFSSDARLMILASDFYDEGEYIRNYDEFLTYIKGQDLAP